jgi:hypothetical protein
MKKRTLVIALAAVVVALLVASVAWAATQGRTGGSAKTGTGPRSAAAWCGALASDPAAWKDMQALRTQHMADMKAWLNTYGQEPSSPDAQAALAKLRSEHWNDMLALMKKYGVSARNGAGPGMMDGGSSSSGWNMMGGTGSSSGAGMMGGAGYGSGMMGGL